MRQYLGRMVIVLTLVTPLLVVMTYQWAPSRSQRPSDELVTVAMASAQTRAAYAQESPGVAASRPQALPPVVSRLAGSDAVRPVAWYRVAAAEHRINPYLLEALHQIESSAATDGCWPNLDGSGAVGPFQFKRPTFDQYGVDGNGDGVPLCDIGAFEFGRLIGGGAGVGALTPRESTVGVNATPNDSRVFQGIATLLPYEGDTIGLQGIAGIAFEFMPGIGGGIEYRYQGYTAATPIAGDAGDNQTIMMRLDLGLN